MWLRRLVWPVLLAVAAVSLYFGARAGREAYEIYQVTEHGRGVAGTFLVTRAKTFSSAGEAPRFELTGDFTPSGGGAVRRHVEMETELLGGYQPGTSIPAVALRHGGGKVWQPGHAKGTGDAVVKAALIGFPGVLIVLAAVADLVRRVRRTDDSVAGEPGTEPDDEPGRRIR